MVSAHSLDGELFPSQRGETPVTGAASASLGASAPSRRLLCDVQPRHGPCIRARGRLCLPGRFRGPWGTAPVQATVTGSEDSACQRPRPKASRTGTAQPGGLLTLASLGENREPPENGFLSVSPSPQPAVLLSGHEPRRLCCWGQRVPPSGPLPASVDWAPPEQEPV